MLEEEKIKLTEEEDTEEAKVIKTNHSKIMTDRIFFNSILSE